MSGITLGFYLSDIKGEPPVLLINHTLHNVRDYKYTPGSSSSIPLHSVSSPSSSVNITFVRSPPSYTVHYLINGDGGKIEIISGDGWLGVSSHINSLDINSVCQPSLIYLFFVFN